jgi:secreted trypsin-like serine protease
VHSISKILRYLIVGLLLTVPASASFGIIIRHDKSDISYHVDEANYQQLFFLHTSFDNKVCVATLINARWAITAAHCMEQTPLGETIANNGQYQVTVAGKPNQVMEIALHPQHNTGNQLENVDLALIRLDRDVENVRPIALYRDNNESDQVFSLLGWGFTGIGTRGLSSNDGRFRRALNRAEEADQWLLFRFDDPRINGNQALTLEGVPGLGDSGGPALLETSDGSFLAGIALGELEEGESPSAQGLYGTTQVYERISSHLEWIDATINATINTTISD